MTIPASALGAQFEPRSVTVTPRMTLAYAAGIGCTQERYLDDARNGSLVAPPPYCASLEWLLAGDIDALAAFGISPDDRLRAVHAGQDTQFHRPLVAGETVSVSGRIEAIHRTRAGACVTSRLEVASSSGDPITTSWSDAIYRGVQTDAEAGNESRTNLERGPTPAEFTESVEIPIAREFPHIYSECASIWNPIHTERRVALAAGLPDIIVHGTALWALVWKQLSETYGEVSRLSGRFMSMAIPGNPVILLTDHLNPETRTVTYRLNNDRGDPAINFGLAKFVGK